MTMQRHDLPLRVVKFGGRVQGDPALAAAVAGAWAAAPGALVVVHGGGDEISTLQRQLGLEPQFAGGRRLTTARDLDVVRMALSGSANKRLVGLLVAAGVRAVGVSGEDAALVRARPLAGGALGCVGAPSAVDARLLGTLLDGGFLPVVSPVSRDDARDDGAALNVNGDDAAAAIAVALGAAELLLVADVSAVIADGAPVATLDVAEARRLVADGTASGGMAAKLDAALGAVDRGVPRVRIGDLAMLSDPHAGTTLLSHLTAVPAELR